MAECLIAVGGGPTPPDPEPDPEPNPTAKWQVAVIYESNDLDILPLAQIDLISGLAFRSELAAQGHRFIRVIDRQDDAGCAAGRCPRPSADVQSWLDAAKNTPLPALAIAPIGGGDIRAFPLPANRAAFWTLLEAQR